MYPARRKLTKHSIPVTATKRLVELHKKIARQKDKEFTDGWANLRTFLNH